MAYPRDPPKIDIRKGATRVWYRKFNGHLTIAAIVLGVFVVFVAIYIV